MGARQPWLHALLGAFALMLAAFCAQAEPVQLRAGHPERYVVQRGDTLWRISALFLHSPWQWPEIWAVNPAVENPHLIYPGDVIRLLHTADGPRLVVERPGTGAVAQGGTTKLQPRIRSAALEAAIPAIPLEALRAFLEDAWVIENPDLERGPYVLHGADEHVVTGAGDRIYGRHATAVEGTDYGVYRLGEPYLDPDSGEYLGHAAIQVATATLTRAGEPSTLQVRRSRQEVLPGDLMRLQAGRTLPANFYPRPPEQLVQGRILRVINGISQIGQYQVVVLNRGARDGLESGHVLGIEQIPGALRDPYSGALIQPPPERTGHAMVLRTFDRLSLALVMKATAAMQPLDYVVMP